MNAIWAFLVGISIVFAVVNGRLEDFTRSIFEAARSAVEVSLFLLGIVALWMGITKIIEDSGLIHGLSRIFRPFVSRLFKSIPPDHPSITSITLNFLANLFGLGNAATPLGIQAMQDLQTLNRNSEKVTDEMMLFVVINTASIQLIPFTVIGLLSDFGSKDPTWIVFPTFLATILSAAFAVGMLWVCRKMLK
jgi:spore maturation protein A